MQLMDMTIIDNTFIFNYKCRFFFIKEELYIVMIWKEKNINHNND